MRTFLLDPRHPGSMPGSAVLSFTALQPFHQGWQVMKGEVMFFVARQVPSLLVRRHHLIDAFAGCANQASQISLCQPNRKVPVTIFSLMSVAFYQRQQLSCDTAFDIFCGQRLNLFIRQPQPLTKQAQ